MVTIEILEPRPSEVKKRLSLSTRPPQLRGRTIAVINNGWPSWAKLTSKLKEEMVSRFGVRPEIQSVDVHPNRPTPEDILYQVLNRCHAVVNGFAN